MYFLEFAGTDDRFAAREAATAASAVTRIGGGIATARGIDPHRVEGLAFTRRATTLLGRTDASVESAVTLLAASDIEGERAGTVAVRARDVRSETGVDTQRAERLLGHELVDRGFTVDLTDPDHELRAVFAPPLDGDSAASGAAGGVCVLGWLVAESVRDYGTRTPTERPFFQPGSMNPLLARALANIVGARPGARVLDPMCGTAGVLVEAGLVGANVLGVDVQGKMVRGARRNLRRYLSSDAAIELLVADAAMLPISDDSIDGVVFDAPYGRQSKVAAADIETLVDGALAEARRVAPRAVVVGDRPWVDRAREAGWTVTDRFQRRVHRTLDRYIMVLVDADRQPSTDSVSNASLESP